MNCKVAIIEDFLFKISAPCGKLDVRCWQRVGAVGTAQIQALQEAKLAFDRVLAIFRTADPSGDPDKCRTRAAMTLITLGISELRDIWSERRVRTAIKRLLDRLYPDTAAPESWRS